jgi:hypothetical protein
MKGATLALGLLAACNESALPLPDGGADLAAASDGPGGDLAEAVCATPPPPGIPDGGVLCAPSHADGGGCWSLPPYTATASRFRLFVVDPRAPGGGWLVDLPIGQTVSAGGHSYSWNSGDTLTGGGANGVFGDASFTVDGVANQLAFHYEGVAEYLGAGVWSWSATVTRTRRDSVACAPATVGRHYTITTTSGAAGTIYTFIADAPPRGCGCGVELLEIDLPG